MPKKRLLLFFSLIILSLILMTYQTKREVINPIRILSYPINIANESISSVCSSIKDILRKIRSSDEENKRLKEELNKLLIDRNKYKEILLENERLRELLSLKETEKRYVTAVRIIARGNERWSNTLVIDKGKKDGIEKDMAVTTARGLVGKVLSVTDSYSNILLINDVNFSASVRLQESRTEGIISGTGSALCVLKYVAHEYDVMENETVLTSGLDSLFPADIPVGTVTRVSKKSGGLFQNIEVTPFQDTKRLEEVTIIRR